MNIGTRLQALSKAAIALFLPLFLLQSCTKPDIVDVGLNAPASVGYLDSTTVSLTTQTANLDSIYTKNVTSAVLGNYVDPNFGRVNAEIYTQFSIDGANVDFPDDAVADSAFIYLPIQSYYGKPSSTLNFEVYEIDESMVADQSYYATTTFATKPTNLSPGFAYAQADDRLEQDTIRIPIDLTLAQSILSADPANLVDNSAFHNFFKGFHIKTQQVSSADIGVVYTIAMRNAFASNASPAFFRIYYSTGTTAVNKFDLKVLGSGATQRTNYLSRSDVAGTTLQTLLDNNDPLSRQIAGLQAVVPVRVFGRIQRLPSSKLAINKAILELPVDQDYIDNNPYKYFRPYRHRLNMVAAAADDSTRVDLTVGMDTYADYDTTYQRFELDITSYVHQLINSGLANSGFLLLPSNYAIITNGVAATDVIATDRCVLTNHLHPTRPPRIRVYYTNIP